MTLACTALFGPGGFNCIGDRIQDELRTHKAKYVAQGIAFIVSGLTAASFPGSSSLNIEFLIGLALLATGILQAVLTFRTHIHAWSLMSAALSIAAGLLILWKPFPVLLAAVTVIAVFMTFEGLLEIYLAFKFRPSKNWHWMLFSGLATLVLADITWICFPAFDALYLNLVIAANFIMYGASLLMLVWRSAS